MSAPSRGEIPLLVFVTALVLTACGRGGADNGGSGEGLRVASSEARSCDVVLELETDEEFHVHFPDRVLGSYFQRGARVGVSVASKSDAALGRFTNGIPSGVTVGKVSCFDRTGRAIPKAGVENK